MICSQCREHEYECFCEPRTTLDMVKDLLEMVREKEFTTAQERCSRSCCYKTYTSCSECRASREGYAEPEKHDDDCRLAALLKEAQAYLDVEEDLLLKQEVPS